MFQKILIFSQRLLTILMCTHFIMRFMTFLFTIFYLEILTYTTPCWEGLKPLLTQWLRILFPFSMLISYIFCFPRGLSRVQKMAVRPLSIWFLHPHPWKIPLNHVGWGRTSTKGLTIYPSSLSFLLCRNYVSLSCVHYGRKQMRLEESRWGNREKKSKGNLHIT